LGQLRDLRTNPNLKGADINFLVQQTPMQLEKLLRLGEIEAKTYKQIMKAFEGRDLGKRGKRK
jgi:predicted transcriptional regulator